MNCCDGPALISVRDLNLSYGDRPAFRGIDMDIPKGCITAIIGPSGCGKSSFLLSLNRMTDLIEGCRVSGSIELNCEDIRAPDLDLVGLRRRVGMIFQKPNPFPLSVRANLSLPLREHGVKDAGKREAIIERSLKEVGLWNEVSDRLDAPALGLSGGQQQRLCIARALALEPEVILFDEPCSALDPIASSVVEDYISSLRGRLTVVIVTHNMAQARRISDQAAFFWMKDGAGQVVECAASEQIFERPEQELTAAFVNGQAG